MWDKLKKQLNAERLQLNRLLEKHHAILEKCKVAEPDVDEVPALASILHSFYTGVESIFKRVAVEIDGDVPHGEFWHTELLESVTRPSPKRPAVISESLNERLQEYLDFRHVFRQAYSFDLKWSKMASLVLEMESVLRRLEEELNRFLLLVDQEDG